MEKIDCKKIEELFNSWISVTIFMSNGNCETESFKKLVEYGKEHIQEVVEYFYNKFLINGILEWTDFSVIDKCIGSPLELVDGHYINPSLSSVQNAYAALLKKELFNFGKLTTPA